MPDDRARGLYGKYKVERNDGQPLKGGCVVLEFGDENARAAILVWANRVRRDGYEQLYKDTITRLAETYSRPIIPGECVWVDDGQGWRITEITPVDDDWQVTMQLMFNPSRKEVFRTLPMLDVKRLLVTHPQP